MRYDDFDQKQIGWFSLYTLIVALALVAAWGAFSSARAADKGGPQILADAPYDAKPVWTGLYVGGNAGVVSGVSDWGAGVDGYSGGAQIGALMQIGRLIAGVEASYDWKKVSFAGNNIDAKQWDVSGRLGALVTDHTMLYGKLSRPTLSVDGLGDSAGIGIGGGLEAMIAKNWSLAGEYMRETYDKIPNARAHEVSLRVNYHIPVLKPLSP